jgi:hypothetical protein
MRNDYDYLAHYDAIVILVGIFVFLLYVCIRWT